MAKKEYKTNTRDYFVNLEPRDLFNSAKEFIDHVWFDFHYTVMDLNFNGLYVERDEPWATVSQYEQKVQENWNEENVPVFFLFWAEKLVEWYGYRLWNMCFNSYRKHGMKEGKASDEATKVHDEFVLKYKYNTTTSPHYKFVKDFTNKVSEPEYEKQGHELVLVEKEKLATFDNLLSDLNALFCHELNVAQEYPNFSEKKHRDRLVSWVNNRTKNMVLLVNGSTFKFKNLQDYKEFCKYADSMLKK